MSLRLPSEIVAEQVVPTLRAMLAMALVDAGLTQTEIADHLGVTQAAVSTYVSGQVETAEPIRADPRTTDMVTRVSQGLASGEMDDFDALTEVLALIHEFEDRGPICELHEAAMPSLQGLGCDLCVRGVDAELSAERAVLSDVRAAARSLATIPGIADLIPNVGTNIGMGLPDATSVADVGAIPGRIYVIGDRVEVPANPEFGASRHVATAVLAAMAVDPTMRGALNLATDERLLDGARDHGLDPVEFDPAYEDRRDRLRDLFEAREEIPSLIYHRGDFGIEPILYVLAPSATDAAELVTTLLAD